ncbi:hypothetical protein BGZ99_003389 [Dissophora globulifera]|uniref:Oligopeptide transporter n=1 Tax=Dissophora globulifera TaxID=979702 RepID=A0A9P6RMH1_9FUNG|nr:hypothetical protein BGZ99_003389 [Dissophora globulifera]
MVSEHHAAGPSPASLPTPVASKKHFDIYDEKDYQQYDESPVIDLEELEKDSPIEEVRVTVSNRDDPSMPYNTFRMWFLGLLFTVIIAFVNQFFYLRQTTVTVGYSVVALISLPMGHFMARVLPIRRYRIPLLGWKFTLNPGPFSIKEHVLIGTMAACNSTTAYAVDIVILQKVFYHQTGTPFFGSVLLVLTTQITGFAMAGGIRRFLVRPAQMVWPQTLVTAALFRSLHASSITSNNDDEDGTGASTEKEQGGLGARRMSRTKYFLLVTLASFIYYWFPGFIFPTIGTISWICWLQPNNVILAQLTGAGGLGIGTIALDWTAISAYVQPLVTPWFAQVNILIGFITMAYILVPWTYYSNLWNAKQYPIISASLFQQDGSEYNVTEVLDKDSLLVDELYTAYGPLRMSVFFAIAYGIGFAALSATVVHTILYHGKDIVARWKITLQDKHDVHLRLMSAYPEVPDWWYGLLFATMFALSFVTCVVYDFMPWWALILALAIAIFFLLPVGIVQAITNQQPGLNIVTEYVIGTLLPGHPIANVTFKTYGYIVNVQALAFASDLKLGHYMKIPPRIMFLVQLVSSVIGCIVNLATAMWLINTRPNICTAEGYPFTCRSTKTFYSASVIWGAIGPAKVFGTEDGSLYSPVQYGFLIGALLPLVFWFLSNKVFRKTSWLKQVHWPVLLAATSNMPPAMPYFYSNGLLVGFIFAFLLRRYRYRWWSRYNYLTSAALDSGVALAGLIIFFALQSGGVQMPHWWGNPQPTGQDANTAIMDHCPSSWSSYNSAV